MVKITIGQSSCNKGFVNTDATNMHSYITIEVTIAKIKDTESVATSVSKGIVHIPSSEGQSETTVPLESK